MQVLSIELTDEEFGLLTAKAGKHDLGAIIRMSLDTHFRMCRYTERPLPPLDLSGSHKALAALQVDRIDLSKPIPPDRGERRLDNGRFRYESDADFDKAMEVYYWQLDRYNHEKSKLQRARERGTWNQFGGISCIL